MSLTFVHTADWHLGQTYWRLGAQATRSRAWRLEAVRRVWQLAAAHHAAFVVVAGDVFDTETPSDAVRAHAIELLVEAPCPVYLVPGQSDACAEGSVWFSAPWQSGLTGLNHVHAIAASEPLEIEGGALLLPCPTMRRRSTADVTRAMPSADRGERFRIGLAHGFLQGYAPDQSRTLGVIAADCAARAGLDYLALGGHHAPTPVEHGAGGGRAFYAGTPEIGAGDDAGAGTALLVQIEHAGALPVVTPQRVGDIALCDMGAVELSDAASWAALLARIGSFERPQQTILRADLRGEISPALYAQIAAWLAALRDQLLGVDASLEAVHPRPTAQDFAQLKLERLEESVLQSLEGALAPEHLSDLRGLEHIESWSDDPDARREALALYFRLLES